MDKIGIIRAFCVAGLALGSANIVCGCTPDEDNRPIMEYPDDGTGGKPEIPEGVLPAEPFAGVRPRNSLVTDEVIARGKALYERGLTDAQWRRDAEARIERDRKGDMSIIVTDAEGNPIEDAKVMVEMTNHEFGFGGALDPAPDKFTDLRKQQFLDMCNLAVFGNNMKWKHDVPNRPVTEPVLNWLNDQGIKVRAHALFWMAWKNLPDGFEAKYKDDPAGLRAEMEKRCDDSVPFWGDRVIEWDVFNEPYAKAVSDVMDLIGWDVVEKYLRRVKELEPDVKCYINDFGLLQNDAAKQEKFANLIKDLQSKNAPIDGIGMQLYPRGKINIENIVERLQYWATLGLELKLTEYAYIQAEVQPSDEIKTRDSFDVLTACFSVKACKGFIWWGPFGGAVFTDTGLSDVGAGFAYLLYDKWWTNAEGKTGVDGVYKTRAFYGDYKITVEYGNESKEITMGFREDAGKDVKIIF